MTDNMTAEASRHRISSRAAVRKPSERFKPARERSSKSMSHSQSFTNKKKLFHRKSRTTVKATPSSENLPPHSPKGSEEQVKGSKPLPIKSVECFGVPQAYINQAAEARSPKSESPPQKSPQSPISPIQEQGESVMAPTFFENVFEPYTVLEAGRALSVNEGKPTTVVCSRGGTNLTVDSLKEEPHLSAIRTLIYADGNDILDNLLPRDGNNKLKIYFTGGMKSDSEICEGLLATAMNNLHKKLVSDSEIMTDENIQKFLNADSRKAQATFLDIILFVPDLLPDVWGGYDVGMKISTNGEAASAKYDEIYDQEKQADSKGALIKKSISNVQESCRDILKPVLPKKWSKCKKKRSAANVRSNPSLGDQKKAN